MLHVTGLVGISTHDDVERVKATTGYVFNFTVVSQEPMKRPPVMHRYRASLWVPDDKLTEWTGKLTRGAVFFIDHAFWRMRENDGQKYPFPSLELKLNGFHLMTTPYWLEQGGENNG